LRREKRRPYAGEEKRRKHKPLQNACLPGTREKGKKGANRGEAPRQFTRIRQEGGRRKRKNAFPREGEKRTKEASFPYLQFQKKEGGLRRKKKRGGFCNCREDEKGGERVCLESFPSFYHLFRENGGGKGTGEGRKGHLFSSQREEKRKGMEVSEVSFHHPHIRGGRGGNAPLMPSNGGKK